MSISTQIENENMVDFAKIAKATSMNPETPKENLGVHMQIVKDYELMTISKKRIVREDFPNQLDFSFSQKREIITCGQQALLSNGLVFAYRKNKVITAVFIVEKNVSSYDCNHMYISSEVSEPDADDMKKDIRRQISLLVYYANFTKGFFAGDPVPMIEKEKRTYAWGIALLVGLLFAICMHLLTQSLPISFFTGLAQTAFWFCILNNRLVYNDTFTSSDEDQV